MSLLMVSLRESRAEPPWKTRKRMSADEGFTKPPWSVGGRIYDWKLR